MEEMRKESPFMSDEIVFLSIAKCVKQRNVVISQWKPRTEDEVTFFIYHDPLIKNILLKRHFLHWSVVFTYKTTSTFPEPSVLNTAQNKPVQGFYTSAHHEALPCYTARYMLKFLVSSCVVTNIYLWRYFHFSGEEPLFCPNIVPPAGFSVHISVILRAFNMFLYSLLVLINFSLSFHEL